MTVPSEVYRHEAQRLYALAETLPFGSVRNELIELARQYEALVRHCELMESRTTTKSPEPRTMAVSIRLVPER